MEKQGFDYSSVVNNEIKIVVQQRTSEIKSLLRRTAQEIIDIGEKLTEVKRQLGHGNFRNWLKAEFNWSVSTAAKFMQVSQQFKCVNFTHLEIAASALYLLATPSTPAVVRQEALERANQGEAISHTKAKTMIARHKEEAKPKVPKPAIVNVLAETVAKDSSTPAEPRPVSQTVETESAAVVEQTEDKLPEKKAEAPANFQMSNRAHDMALDIDSGGCPPKDQIVEQFEDQLIGKEIEALAYFQVSNRPYNLVPVTDIRNSSLKDQAEIDMQLLFGVGNLLCITDFQQQESKWLGEVAEVKKATASDIEVLIKISLQPN